MSANNMPFLTEDRAANRWVYQRRFPAHLTYLTGAWYRHKYPVDQGYKAAEADWHNQTTTFKSIVAEAETLLASVEGSAAVLEFSASVGRRQRAERRLDIRSRIESIHSQARRLGAEADLHAMANRLGMAASTLPTISTVAPEQVIDAWIGERNSEHRPADRKRITEKRTALDDLFSFARTRNIAEIGLPMMRRYRQHIIQRDQKNGTAKARHLLIALKALFAVAVKADLITDDPAAKLVVPPKSDKVSQPFSDTEARLILLAARHAEPVVRWAHWLAGFSTAHNKEILTAHADEFRQIAGQWVWDMRGRKLKSEARPRILALHPSVLREGFLDYLATRHGKPLFSGSFNANDPKLNALIRGLGIEKRFYSWRKRNSFKLAKLAGPELGRYLSGHAAKDIAERFYRFHELPDEFSEIVAAINGLVDPTQSVENGRSPDPTITPRAEPLAA